MERIIKILLFLTALTPLIFSESHIYTYVFPKITWFQTLVEIAFILFLIYMLVALYQRKSTPFYQRLSATVKRPLFISIILFFLIAAGLSTIFAVSNFDSFYGDIERGEGFLVYLHYLVFLVLLIGFFNKKDWLRYFYTSLVVGVIVMFYAWLQRWGVTEFPFAQSPQNRTGSLLGNPTYLAAYLLLLPAFVGILWREKVFHSAKTELFILGGFTALTFSTIFITQTRAAIIGFSISVFVLMLLFIFGKRYPISLRVVSLTLLVFFIIFTGIFWSTRTADLWQSVPGLNRFANLSFKTESTRLIALGVSLEAFKEKPIFGWGQENYNVAYNAHYNPAYAGAWFDRAHNKIAGTAVMFGGVGLVFYLAIFVLLFRLLFSHSQLKGAVSENRRRIGNALIASVIVGYFIQNLAAFDMPTSYIPFFTILGFVLATSIKDRNNPTIIRCPTSCKHILAAAIFIIIGVTLYSLYVLRYIPFKQSYLYVSSLQKGGEALIANASDFLYPYNYLQRTLRVKFLNAVKNSGGAINKDFFPVADIALKALIESVERQPLDPRPFQLLSEFYFEKGKADEKFYKDGEKFARQGLELAPRRQSLQYLLSVSLSVQDKHAESLLVLREALELNPRVPQSYYYLGSALAAADAETNYEQAKYYLLKARELGLPMRQRDFENYFVFYNAFKEWQLMADLAEEAVIIYPENQSFHSNAIIAYRALRDADGIIRHAEAIKSFTDDELLHRDLDLIINFVRNGRWDILDKIK